MVGRLLRYNFRISFKIWKGTARYRQVFPLKYRGVLRGEVDQRITYYIGGMLSALSRVHKASKAKISGVREDVVIGFVLPRLQREILTFHPRNLHVENATAAPKARNFSFAVGNVP